MVLISNIFAIIMTQDCLTDVRFKAFEELEAKLHNFINNATIVIIKIVKYFSIADTQTQRRRTSPVRLRQLITLL
jgi:hypothetical protein